MIRGGGGGHSQYILVGTGTTPKMGGGGLGTGTTPKNWGLRHRYEPKKGGLRNGHNSEKGTS